MTSLHFTRAVFAILLIVHVAHAEIPEVDESDDPASIADLAPKTIPDEQNAAVHLEHIAADLEAFSRAYGRFYNSPQGDDLDDRQRRGEPPTAEQLAAIQEILDSHSVIVDVFEKAAACDQYASQLDFTLPASNFLEQVLDRTQNIRTLARGVQWKITLLLVEGRRNDAVRLGTQMLRMARLYEDEPTLVNYLVSTAVRGITIDALNTAVRSGPIDLQVQSALLAELAAQNGPSLQRALRSERAVMMSNLIAQLEPARTLPKGIPPQLLQWQMRETNAIDRALRSADKHWFEIRTEWEPPAIPQATVAPSLTAAFKAEARRLALVRCLRILIALDEYRERNGKEATEIDQLELPVEVVIDPFSGALLKLKRIDDGWVIYTVFENGVDDSGDFRDLKDCGLAPPGYQINETP